jgi:hypothetical protein
VINYGKDIPCTAPIRADGSPDDNWNATNNGLDWCRGLSGKSSVHCEPSFAADVFRALGR